MERDAARGREPQIVPVLATIPCFLMARAHARVSALLVEHLPARADIHRYAALLALSRSGPVSQQELARLIGVSRTTMVAVADGLVDAGLVERVRNPADRRSYALTRTHEGVLAVRRWRRHVDGVEAALEAHYSDGEADRVRRHLQAFLRPYLAPDTPAQLLRSIGFLVTQAHAEVHRVTSEALRPFDLDPRQFAALIALRETGPTSQGEMARQLGKSPAAIVQVADELEERGVLERRLDESDRRARVLHLLPAAYELLSDALMVAGPAMDKMFAVLAPDELADLIDLLQPFVTEPPASGAGPATS